MEIKDIPEFTIIIEDDIVESTDANVETPVEETTEETPPIIEYAEDSDPNAIAFYEELKERGYLTDEFDGSWETLDKMFTDLPNKILKSLIEQAPEITKQVVRFAFASENITQEDLVNFVKVYNEELSDNVEITTMDEARSYLEKVYAEKGLSKKIIEATLNTLEDDEELLDEAKSFKEKEINFKKTEKLISDKENESLVEKQRLLDFNSKITEELTNSTWKPAKIEKVKQVLSNNSLTTTLNDIITNPKSLIKLADFLSYYKDGDIDYTKFINQLETPVAKDLKSRIESAINSPGINNRSASNQKNIQFNIENEKPII